MGYPDWEPPGIVNVGGGGKIAEGYTSTGGEVHEIAAGKPFAVVPSAEKDVFYCGTLRLLTQVTVPGGEANVEVEAQIGGIGVGKYSLDLGSNATFAVSVERLIVALIVPKGKLLRLGFVSSQQTGTATFAPTAMLALD